MLKSAEASYGAACLPYVSRLAKPQQVIAQGLERNRDGDRHDQREPESLGPVVERTADGDHDDDIRPHHEGGRSGEHHGPADDHIDVVEPVAQDRDRDRDKQIHVRQVRAEDSSTTLSSQAKRLTSCDQDAQQSEPDCHRSRQHPLDLLADHAGGATEPDHRRIPTRPAG